MTFEALGTTTASSKVPVCCLHCGTTLLLYPSQAKTRKYCSNACKYEAQKNRGQRTCQFCGNKFEVKASTIADGYAIYCSRECKYKGLKGPITKLECEHCGRMFEVKEYETLRRSNVRFCSPECNSAAQQVSITRLCETCGEEFEAKPSNVRRGWARFCSTKCYGEWCSVWRCGEHNPVWKGGSSFEPYPPEFNAPLKRQIRKRDSYRCAICGKNARCVHHIDYDKHNSSPSNLVTLCIPCHNKTNHHRKKWQRFFNARMEEQS